MKGKCEKNAWKGECGRAQGKRESVNAHERRNEKNFTPNVFRLIAHHHHHHHHQHQRHHTSHVHTIASNQTNYKQNVEVSKVNGLSSALRIHR